MLDYRRQPVDAVDTATPVPRREYLNGETRMTVKQYIIDSFKEFFEPIPIVWAALKRNLWVHKWKYYNPYNRTCKVCNRQEVQHYTFNRFGSRVDYWEVFNEGDPENHYNGNPK